MVKEEIEALCALAHECARRGWVPATAGNFSVRDAESGAIFISRSGLDKGRVTAEDLLTLDANGLVTHGEGKPSAEAGLHVVVYRERPQAQAIAHVHTVWNTLLSTRCAEAGHVAIEGYELLEGALRRGDASASRAHSGHCQRTGLPRGCGRNAVGARRASAGARGFVERAWPLYLGHIGGRGAPAPGGAGVSVRGGMPAADV